MRPWKWARTFAKNCRKLGILIHGDYVSKNGRTVFKSSPRSLFPLALPCRAALTPREWDVTLVDEQVQNIDFNSRPDLVAITIWAVHSIRGYDLDRKFRSRGIPVIMGGPHVWFHPVDPDKSTTSRYGTSLLLRRFLQAVSLAG